MTLARAVVQVTAGPIWAHKDMYDVTKACQPGDVPRASSMVDYRVLIGTDMAEFVKSS